MDLLTKVKGLKIVDGAGLLEQDMKLVLTEVNFDKKDQVYRAARAGLQKYMRDSNHQGETPVMKQELALTAKLEATLVEKGWSRPIGESQNQGPESMSRDLQKWSQRLKESGDGRRSNNIYKAVRTSDTESETRKPPNNTILPNDGKKFRFGGGEVLPTTKRVAFPGRLANQSVMFSSHKTRLVLHRGGAVHEVQEGTATRSQESKQGHHKTYRKSHEDTLYNFPTGDLKLVVYSDAAYTNLPDQISSGRGHIVMLADEEGQVAPIGWTSNKVKRVVNSTVAAQALSLQMTISHAVYLRTIFAETLGVDVLTIQIYSFVDS